MFAPNYRTKYGQPGEQNMANWVNKMKKIAGLFAYINFF